MSFLRRICDRFGECPQFTTSQILLRVVIFWRVPAGSDGDGGGLNGRHVNIIDRELAARLKEVEENGTGDVNDEHSASDGNGGVATFDEDSS